MNFEEQIDKYKNAIINIAVIVITLVIASNIYKGKAAEINSLKIKIDNEEKKNVELNEISRAQMKLDAYKKLFVKKEASSVMTDISDIAKVAGVKVVAVKPSQAETSEDYSKDIFEVTVNALSYDGLAKFISNIESFSNVYIIDGIQVRPVDKLEKKGLRADLRISSVITKQQ